MNSRQHLVDGARHFAKVLLRILLKQNTALLYHVCVSVSHRRDISSFLDNLIVLTM